MDKTPTTIIKDNYFKCDKGLSFEDCELQLLRHNVDKAQEIQGKKKVDNPEIKKMVKILEDFLKRKQLCLYGGFSISAALPEAERFYNFDVELPDYDFFSMTPREDAVELADIYYKQGFKEIEVKAGMHHLTFKVYVDYQPLADITFMPEIIYKKLKKDALIVDGLYLVPPNFLRMSAFLELSRTGGDVSRFEKVFKRISLLNQHYPFISDKTNCDKVKIQRELSDKNKTNEKLIYDTVRDIFIKEGCVFFGSFCISLYSHYLPRKFRKKLKRTPDFDVLSKNIEETADTIIKDLKKKGIKNVTKTFHEKIGEIIPPNYELKVGEDTIAFIHEPIACHSYNLIKIKGENVKIATIETLFSFYLAFIYVDKPYFNAFSDRLLCICKFLFELQQKNRLNQSGILKRFSLTCYGYQKTKEDILAEKAAKYKELKNDRDNPEYQEYFFHYRPVDINGVITNSYTLTDSLVTASNSSTPLSKESVSDLISSLTPTSSTATASSKKLKKSPSLTSSKTKTKKLKRKTKKRRVKIITPSHTTTKKKNPTSGTTSSSTLSSSASLPSTTKSTKSLIITKKKRKPNNKKTIKTVKKLTKQKTKSIDSNLEQRVF